jgi:ADP-ribosylglycohydrolase
MFAPIPVLRQQLSSMLRDQVEKGRDPGGLAEEIGSAPDDYQRLYDLALRIDAAPVRADWAYVEPSDLPTIHAEQAKEARSSALEATVRPADSGERAAAGFYGSVAGCILGKPVEIMPDLEELRAALTAIGEWPLDDYISVDIRDRGGLRALHPDWPESVRENIQWVTADDDINYTLLGMLTLEKYGREFTKGDLRRQWLENVPLGFTWGPERGFLAKQALAMGIDDEPEQDLETLADGFNPGQELCGAMIRADAYGYAAPGRPDIASDLAWRDATLTHRGNGVYGSMFAAAAIAAAATATDPLEIFEVALRYVPQRSRFHAIVADSLELVRRSGDWLEGYEGIHGRYARYGHCRVFQESGLMINTLKHARSVGEGICIQVSQGNDTDSYGATAGSILGVFFGPGHLEDRWITPFNDTLHTRLAGFYELSLSSTAERISRLPFIGLPDESAVAS